MPVAHAALIDLGGSPLVGLIVLVIVVGIVALIAIKLVSFIPMLAPFKEIATWLIYMIAVLIIVVKAAEVIFGITIFSG